MVCARSMDESTTMSLATKLLGVTALCVACCALPLTSVFAAGMFGFGAMSWGISGGIAFLVVAASLFLLLSRRSAFAGGKLAAGDCSCSSGSTLAAPIACTLPSTGYQERVKSIRALAAHSLVSARRTPLSLHLVYHRDALQAVQKLVEEERSCCAFLRFKLADEKDSVHLSITASEESAQAADVLFSHFAPELAHQKN